jgi:hypothetical protein
MDNTSTPPGKIIELSGPDVMYHYGIALGMFGFVGFPRWQIKDDAKTKDALN